MAERGLRKADGTGARSLCERTHIARIRRIRRHDLLPRRARGGARDRQAGLRLFHGRLVPFVQGERGGRDRACSSADGVRQGGRRSEEHTSELQSLMRISYAVVCLKKKG